MLLEMSTNRHIATDEAAARACHLHIESSGAQSTGPLSISKEVEEEAKGPVRTDYLHVAWYQASPGPSGGDVRRGKAATQVGPACPALDAQWCPHHILTGVLHRSLAVEGYGVTSSLTAGIHGMHPCELSRPHE